MVDARNPHDALFKKVFSIPQHAAAVLRAVLPASLLKDLDFSTLELCPGSFVDAELSSSHSDLLFKAEVAGKRCFFYLLFEHQSTVDELMALRLWGYAHRIVQRAVDAAGGGRDALPLPPVIAVVVHHSEGGWTAATSLQELYAPGALADAEVRRLAPRFAFVLDDLSRLSDEALRDRALGLWPTLTLWALRDARSPARLLGSLRHWTAAMRALLMAPSGREALATIFRYIVLVNDRATARTIYATVAASAPELEEAVISYGEELLAEGEARGRIEGEARGRIEGEARGRIEGEARGRIEGEAKALLAVLDARGLTLNEAQRQQIADCGDPALLERWLRHAATAREASEVFR